MRFPVTDRAVAQRFHQPAVAQRAAAVAQEAQQVARCRLGRGRIHQPVRHAGRPRLVGGADVVDMPRRRGEARHAGAGHHPGNERGRPRVVDQEGAAVAVGVARAQRRQAAAGAGNAAHRVERAAVAPVAGHALPGDQAVVGQVLVLRFGDAEAGRAPLAVDEGAVPEPMFIAGSIADGDRQRTEAEAGWHVAGFGGGG